MGDHNDEGTFNSTNNLGFVPKKNKNDVNVDHYI